MAAYEQAYGFTRQRLLVTACELWLGVVFLLILVAGIRLRGRWVPRAALAAAVAALLGLATLNPDAFIAQQNIARFLEHRPDRRRTTSATLSADAVPALQTLPEPYRSCALAAINNELAACPAGNLVRVEPGPRHSPGPAPRPPSGLGLLPADPGTSSGDVYTTSRGDDRSNKNIKPRRRPKIRQRINDDPFPSCSAWQPVMRNAAGSAQLTDEDQSCTPAGGQPNSSS